MNISKVANLACKYAEAPSFEPLKKDGVIVLDSPSDMILLSEIGEGSIRETTSKDLNLFERAIKAGDRGEKILKIQKMLNRLGYETEESGIFDEEMSERVKEFQRKNGLEADSIVGNMTYGIMWSRSFWENNIAQCLSSDEFFKSLPSEVKLEVNLTDQRLYLKDKDTDEIIRRYPVSTGMEEYPTPAGSYTSSRAIIKPPWYPPNSEWAKDSKAASPGPDNPLGPVCIPLAENPGVLIHGVPASKFGCIGNYPASHACIRMFPQDAWELHKIIKQGTFVEIKN